jgi:uncharacterized membrane protein
LDRLINSTLSQRAKHRRLRVLGMLAGGVAATALTGVLGTWAYAPAVGWTLAALIYNAWAWVTIAPMDHARTTTPAQEEEPGFQTTDLLILLAAIGSLAAVVMVMAGGKDVEGAARLLLALTCTALPWLTCPFHEAGRH